MAITKRRCLAAAWVAATLACFYFAQEHGYEWAKVSTLPLLFIGLSLYDKPESPKGHDAMSCPRCLGFGMALLITGVMAVVVGVFVVFMGHSFRLDFWLASAAWVAVSLIYLKRNAKGHAMTRLLVISACLVCPAAATAADSDLFAGKGTTQPDTAAVAPGVPATQPARGATTRPETITVKQLVERIPEICWDPKADIVGNARLLTQMFQGKVLALPKDGWEQRGQELSCHSIAKHPKAVKGRLSFIICVNPAPGTTRLPRMSRRAEIVLVELFRGEGLSIKCQPTLDH